MSKQVSIGSNTYVLFDRVITGIKIIKYVNNKVVSDFIIKNECSDDYYDIDDFFRDKLNIPFEKIPDVMYGYCEFLEESD